jgi:hypothetical protein
LGLIDGPSKQAFIIERLEMIKCPVCGANISSDASFCGECGVCLSDAGSLFTVPLPEEELPSSQADPWSRIVDGYDDVELPTDTTALRIVVTRSKRQVRFPLPIEEISMGRRDSSCGVSPDLDLGPDGGLFEGVSRQHAKILQLGNRLLIEDVGSANGTFLNDECIKPYLLYPLGEGTILQLGGLRLLVKFE